MAFATAFSIAMAAVGQAPACPCDCDGNGRIGISELISAVGIVLGRADLPTCVAADRNGNGQVAINELVAGVNAALFGCTADTPTATAVPTPTVAPDSQLPPLGGDALLAWLQAGSYRAWRSESTQHASVGPHFGQVRTFVNDLLFTSLEDRHTTPADFTAHPQGAAAVKELFGSTGTEIRGWAVSVKVEDESDGGNGWYWYERFGVSVFADRRGATGCTGCHGMSSPVATSKDYVLAPFPLQ